MKKRTVVIAVAATVLGILLFVAVARATDSSSFCPSCHEMEPYYDSWAESPMGQNGVDCVDCHVDRGVVPRLLHKFVALREVYSHVTGDNKFPRAAAPEVPDERCKYCHEKVAQPAIPGFDHTDHSKLRDCQTCHATSGHRVTFDMLKAAGILDEENAKSRIVETVAANQLPGHVSVTCTDCHDMSTRTCTDCHEVVHDKRVVQPCDSCHALPSDGWRASTHAAETPCSYCHIAPADHYGDDCGTCHSPSSLFENATGTPIHTGAVPCTKCHSKPAGHRPTGNSCHACHTPGARWTFSHSRITSSGVACTTCHSKPAGHPPTGSTCQTCHVVGVNWSFSHDRVAGSGAACTVCHAKSGGHPATSNQCQDCHDSGVSWAFNHARIPGGEHTYRSFSCATCHPSGFGSYSCLSCHSDNSGGDD